MAEVAEHKGEQRQPFETRVLFSEAGCRDTRTAECFVPCAWLACAERFKNKV